MEEERTTYNYLVSWDMFGLDGLVNMTRAEQEHIIAVLAADDPKKVSRAHSNPLHYMLMRAKFNEQRNFEVYAFISELEEDVIEEMFKTDPQAIADAIRRVGKCLHGQRPRRNQVIK